MIEFKEKHITIEVKINDRIVFLFYDVNSTVIRFKCSYGSFEQLASDSKAFFKNITDLGFSITPSESEKLRHLSTI